MKRFSILSLICLAAFTLQSCLFSEDDIFEDSSTNRTNQALDNYQALLTSATNGWKLEYYPGGKSHDIGGVTMLMKFEGEDVTIMSDTKVHGYNDKEETQAGQRVTSKFKLIADQGPVLSFSTYNVLIHYWTEPRGGLDVDGFAGDFEFVITAATENELTLKGKKHGTVMHMKRLADATDWGAYIAACNAIRTESEEYGTLVGFKGAETFTPSAFSQENVITFSETSANGETSKRRVSFAYTDKGLRLYSPTLVNGVECDNFIWDNATKSFTSTSDNTIQLKYVRPADYVPIEFYTNHTWELTYDYDFGKSDTTETISFTRMEDTDTLQTKISALGMKFKVKAVYNHTTGMLEFNTQYLDMVVLSTEEEGEMDAYIHLCPWDENAGNMYLTPKAGLVSHTTQMSPRIFEFTDNGRISESSVNGFVFYAFKGVDRTSDQLGVLNTYSQIKLKQKN